MTTKTHAPLIASPTKAYTTEFDSNYGRSRHAVYLGSHRIGLVGKTANTSAKPRQWYANRSTTDAATYHPTKTAAVRHLILHSGILGAPCWAYYGETWEQHAERIQAETDEREKRNQVVADETTMAAVLAKDAIDQYREAAGYDFYEDQALAQRDLDAQMRAASLLAQGKTRAAFDELKGLDTVVRDSIRTEVWEYLIGRLGLI